MGIVSSARDRCVAGGVVGLLLDDRDEDRSACLSHLVAVCGVWDEGDDRHGRRPNQEAIGGD